jgi:hypothetical protein
LTYYRDAVYRDAVCEWNVEYARRYLSAVRMRVTDANTDVKLSSEIEASVSSLNPPLTELQKPFAICEQG